MKRYVRWPQGGLTNLPLILGAPLLCFLLSATGGGDGGLINLPGGGGEKSTAYEVLVPLGDHVLALHGDYVDVLRQNGEMIGTYEMGGGETTVSYSYTCRCHPAGSHTISTKITNKYEDEDLRKHDRKLAKHLKRHPPKLSPTTGPRDPTQGPGKRLPLVDRLRWINEHHEQQRRWHDHDGRPGSPAHRYRRPTPGTCQWCPGWGQPTLRPITVAPAELKQNGHLDK